MIDKYQRKDKELEDKRKRANYPNKYFRGGGIVKQVIYRSDNFMPKIL